MPGQYSYEKLPITEFKRLVDELASRDPGYKSGTLIHVELADEVRTVDAEEWLFTQLERHRQEVWQLSRGHGHLLLATNLVLTGESLDTARREQAAAYGVASVDVWCRDDIDRRFEAAPHSVRIDFKQALPEQERRTEVLLWERLAAVERELRGDFRDMGLTTITPAILREQRMTVLNLADNDITELPSGIKRSVHLTALYLQGNRLVQLPSEIGALTRLETLDVRGNLLSRLPKTIGGLTNLRALKLSGNELTSLPVEIGQLSSLETLDLQDNNLRVLPPEIERLPNLTTLNLQGNPLQTPPVEVGHLIDTLQLANTGLREVPLEYAELQRLTLLDLRDNNITVLPSELSEPISNGLIVKLDGNPLVEPFPELVERGPEALGTYLRSLRGAVAHYEAKVLLVGEGNVGKTSLVAAIRNDPFVENRPTTHGIEIRSLTMRHPDQDQDMTVRTWDFGGQEVYRITHQFFFSDRALYLVVWNARQGQEQDEVDGWLRRIRLRVGSHARALVVATHSEERRPELDYPSLRHEFPDLLHGRFDIDSRTSAGIPALREALAEQAARLPHMGQLWNRQWMQAREEIRNHPEPQISHDEFVTICARHGLADDEIDTLAKLLHDLGQIVYYGDDDGLRDVVVLNPEWLTKAIGYVLEDRQTRDSDGVLTHARLADIWQNTPDGFSYPRRFHPFFLRLMEKFDVSYRLDERHSLVAQLVSHARPELPWDTRARPPDGIRTLAFTCQLSEPAPGLVAWLTVRHHNATTGKHWRRGVFLRHPNTAYASEALLELRSDRELFVEVRAPSPDMYFNVLRDSVEALLRRRWPGLSHELSIPCPSRDADGTPCPARFELAGLMGLRENGGISHTCLKCVRTHDVPELLTGFSVPASALQPALDGLEQRVREVSYQLDRYAADVMDSLNRVLKTIAVEVNDCPRLFTLTQPLPAGWQRLRIGRRVYRLVLWCEHPGAWHPWADAAYELAQPREWLTRIAPYASLVVRTLRLVVPVAKDVAGVTLDPERLEHAKGELELMKTLVDKLPGWDVREPDPEPAVTTTLTSAEGEALRALRILLFEHDRFRSFGGLRRVHGPAGDFLWVCAEHYREYDPGLPDLSA